jgi:putative ABC transport system permease protein
MLSIITGIVLFVLATPYFSKLVGKNLTFDLSGQAPFWISALGTIIAGSFLSGVYPAFVISSFRPLTALKGKFVRNASSARLRRGMVVFQFAASITLIIATLTIYEQLEFMRDQDLGMNIHQKVVLRAPKLMKGESYMNEMDYFKDKVKTHPEVISVTASSEVPGKGIFWSNEFRRKDEPSDVRRLASILAVDEDFIPTYNMKLVAGRNFSRDRTSEYGRTIIINESAGKLLGLKDPEAAINQDLVVGDRELKTIIGVVKDFHQESLKQSRSPIIIYWIPWRQDYLTVSIQGTNLRTIMKEIEDTYRTCFPENAFDYFFLDDQFNQQYQSEERTWNVFILFSILSISVAGIGLFGLSLFITIQRTKEIAIRKIVGATVVSITMLLSGDFLKLVAVAFTIATPLSWYLMNQWLEGFAYRVTIPWWTFCFSGALTLAIAFLTVGFQSFKAALNNPVDGIKAE